MFSTPATPERAGWEHASSLLSRLCDESAFIFFRYRLQPAHRCEYVSPAVARVLGYTPEEYYADPDLARKTVDADDAPIVAAILDNPSVTASAVTIHWRRRDGTRMATTQWIYPILDEAGKVRAFEGVARVASPPADEIGDDIRDVGDGNHTAVELEHFFSMSLDLFCIADTEGRFRRVNPAFGEMLGYDEHELRGRAFLDFVHEQDRERTVDATRKLAAGREIVSFENRYRCRDGSLRWLAWKAAPSPDGKLIYATAQDNTKRRALEAELERRTQESAERYRDIFEHAPIGIVEAAPTGDIVIANPAAARMLGYDTAAELERLHMRRDVYRFPEEREAVLRDLAEHRVIRDREVVWKRRDGSDIWVRLDATFEYQGDAVYCEYFVRDVTEQKNLEAQLAQAQKLEAVGRLAGGIAHDFNNLITTILTPADLLLMDLPPGDRTRPDLEDIRAAALRASELTGQLLAFSRQQMITTTLLDLDEIVGNLQRMLRRLIGEDMQLQVRLGAGGVPLRGNRTQIEQVVMNLAANARDAMPQGGRLTIETGSVEFDAEYVARRPGLRAGRHVMLAVSDTGQGMDAVTRERVFEPFFTTKEVGKGTGLGLSTVYGIVRQLDGHVWVYSEPEHGSTFKLFFPAVVGETLAPDAPPADTAPAHARGETVLLVEDEDAVRNVAARSLRRFGYEVLTAGSGAEALSICEHHAGRIDLLLSDVVMPEMGGAMVHAKVRELRPDIRVLYMSGYTDDAVIRHGILEGGVFFLSKPFTPLSLARRVRQVLDGGAP